MKIKLKATKSLLSRGIGFLSLFILLIMVSSCIKGFKKVTVRVYDVETNEGIEGIDLYVETSLGETDRFETDADGLVELGRREYIRGSSIQTNLGIPGYTTPEFYKNCAIKTSYPIEGKNVEIPLEKLLILKLNFEIAPKNNELSGCFVLDDIEGCDGNWAFNYTKTQDLFEISSSPQHNSTNNYIVFSAIAKSPNPLKLVINYEMKENCEVTNNSQIYTIKMNHEMDTTHYTVLLEN